MPLPTVFNSVGIFLNKEDNPSLVYLRTWCFLCIFLPGMVTSLVELTTSTIKTIYLSTFTVTVHESMPVLLDI
jgi:hypothetical protein